MPYAYAITTHKAQGSTVDHAFVDATDMKGCPDLQKILYTALTRAKDRVFIPE
ncbi:MAG: ATP-binding domain-containing protein [Xenococcaceae cyanobacterium MO_188.B32]|nr:ATP-binding domain-containing protein [Xenococcaceae cyanobacterium MO_188.B32]